MKPQPLLLIACLLAGIGFAYGQNIYYVTQNGAGAKDGTDWADAYDAPAFRSVLKTANYGTVYWLASGTYTPGNGQDSSFSVPSGVKLYGGFPATGNPTFADRNITSNPTILSGEIGNPILTDNCYHVVQFSYVDSNTILDGLTISNGYANGNSENGNGAGIYNNGSFSSLGSSPRITNCILSNNYANNDGAGIYNNATNSGRCRSRITNCGFYNNTANVGGGIYNNGSIANTANPSDCSVLLSQCKFTHNTANYGAAALNDCSYGGSNYSEYINCLFTKNHSVAKGVITNYEVYGGGGYHGSCVITVTNCTFAKDSGAVNSASLIYNNASPSGGLCSAVLTNCILWTNPLPYIENNNGSTTVNYSDIQGGYAGTGNIAVDPMFIDETNDNYLIASCSPCVNAGTDSLAPNMDIDSTARPIKGAYDIGAYESKDTGMIAASVSVSVFPNDTFCGNVNAIFTASTSTPTPSYRWQVNGVTAGTSSPTFTSSMLNSGDMISCKVTSTASCLSPNNATSGLQVYVKPVAVAGFTYSHNGNDYDFTDTSLNAANIKWYFGDGDSSVTSNPSHTYSGNGSYIAMLIAYNDCGADTSKQNINLATGINDLTASEISIYPDPVKDYLFISSKGGQPETVSIFDVNGKKVIEQAFTSKIGVSSLSEGVYVIEIKGNLSLIRQKFLKL